MNLLLTQILVVYATVSEIKHFLITFSYQLLLVITVQPSVHQSGGASFL